MKNHKLQQGLKALNRIKLLMEYDMSKTSTENVLVLEQGATTTTTTSSLDDLNKYSRNWYEKTEPEPEKEGMGSAIKDIISLATPNGIANRRITKSAEEINKDKEEMGAERMTEEERNKLFYVVPLPPNNQNKKVLLIPKMWDEQKYEYSGTKNSYTLWGQKSIEDEMKSFGIDKWKTTAWVRWIPSKEKWRQMFPAGTLRAIWIGDTRYSARIALPDKNTENTTGDDFYFTWYMDDDNPANPYIEKRYMDPEGKDPYQKKFAKPWWEDSHVIMELTQMALCFFPPVGTIIGSAIGIVNAASYYEEGNTYEAGLMTVFALLPFALEIPGVKQLGSKAMAALASKFAKTVPKGTQQLTGEMIKQFTEQETNALNEIVNIIKNNPEGLAQSLNDAGVKLIETVADKETNLALKKTAQELLKKTSTTRIILRKGGEFVTGMIPYVGADLAYGQAYDWAKNEFTLKGKIESDIKKENKLKDESGKFFTFERIKNVFYSSGSEEDNLLLAKAWEKGWRPGQPVPEEFQTQTYKTEI